MPHATNRPTCPACAARAARASGAWTRAVSRAAVPRPAAWGRGASRALRFGRRWLAGAALAFAVACGSAGPPAELANATAIHRPARIHPDYSGLVIPPNIAPLNFSIQEDGTEYCVVVRGAQGAPVAVRSRKAVIAFGASSWQALLRQNSGGELRFELYRRAGRAGWEQFDTVTNRVAGEPIDPYLFYRKIYPYHNSWSAMGIYERRLETFDERPVLQTECGHCHSLCNQDPSHFSVDIRSEQYGSRLVLIEQGKITTLSGTVGFAAWHPSGRLLVSSFNQPRLLLHSQKNDMRDIIEFEGWLGCLQPGSNVVRRIPGLDDPARLFTAPTWSPDGRYLYFCSAPRRFQNFDQMLRDDYQKVKYDLMRVAYDLDRDAWGALELVLSSATTGLSAAQPRLSPDGRWLTFCLCPYGCWPTYQPESDLYRIDLKAAGPVVPQKLPVNSDQCESWHSWSSNSRWLVFGSKRGNPLFNRPYLVHVDAEGNFSKPFVVPQRDPDFYESTLKTFTIPTLAIQPLPVTERDLARALSVPKVPALAMPAGKAHTPGGRDDHQSIANPP